MFGMITAEFYEALSLSSLYTWRVWKREPLKFIYSNLIVFSEPEPKSDVAMDPCAYRRFNF
jgi:hypothetical protein